MKKRLRLTLTVLLVAGLGGLAWRASPSREVEPEFEGRSLTWWLEGYGPVESTLSRIGRADKAVQETGTNAIPTLLHLLQAKDPPWQSALVFLEEKQPKFKFPHTEAWRLNFRGWQGFKRLGVEARGAVPALMDIFEHHVSAESQVDTALSLGAIGPPARPAVPLLLRGMTNVDSNFRCNMMIALGRIHSEPEMVVPVLTRLLADSDPQTRRCAVETLAAFGVAAEAALPALLALVNDPSPTVRDDATNALASINFAVYQ